MGKQLKLGNKIAYRIVAFFLIVFNVTIFAVAFWGQKTYDINLAPTVNSLFSENEGMDNGIVLNALLFCLPFFCASVVIALAFVFADKIILCKDGTDKGIRTAKIFRIVCYALAIVMFFGNILYIDVEYGMGEFISLKMQKTDIYQNEYVDPQSVEIQDPDKKRNVIIIYLESMETTRENGRSGTDYTPKLTDLAANNISFSDKDGVGGTSQLNATNWTMATLFATSTGLPWAFKPGEKFEDGFACNAYGIGDFLNEKDYNQEFLCGSDIRFAYRDKFFDAHGGYKIFDYYTALEKGDVKAEDYVWWGLEDRMLYEIAKREITELADKGKPFNFTMLTVDTHPIGGYRCELCGDKYENQTANVLACADNQIYSFVEWLREQPFFENTTVVITGDHLRSDTRIYGGVDKSKRKVYNCFINSVVSADSAITKNRTFTSLDMFPTILTAMGYKIEGNRLGMGVNLFSGEQTLAERLTFDVLNKETEKKSDYYLKRFS